MAQPADLLLAGGGTLTVLGCDGSYPGPGGAASGYLVEVHGLVVWLDAGSGTFSTLQRLVDPRRIDAVVLSHEHPDHWSDLESFAVWLLQHRHGAPVPVHAAPGIRARSYFADAAVFSWHELEPSEQLALGPRDTGDGGVARGFLQCTFSVTDHGPETLAVRFDPIVPARDASRSLAYTADTGPGWSVAELGTGIGTVLCEASYTRDHEGEQRHLSGHQAGVMAAGAKVGTLVVTHRWPWVPAGALAAEADDAFGRPVHQATPGLVVEW